MRGRHCGKTQEGRGTAPTRPPSEAGPHAPKDDRAPHEHEREGDDGAPATRAREVELDALDPSQRQLASLAPPPGMASVVAQGPSDVEPSRHVHVRSLEELLPELVRKVAWAGDGKRGVVRLELGAGAYAGANVVVHADGGRVRVELAGLPEASLAPLRARLDARLRAHGLDVDEVT